MTQTPPPVPSPSALMSAAARAAHLEVDHAPYLFGDRYAGALVDALGDEPLSYHRRFPAEPVLVGARVSTALRSRYAEDRLAASPAPQYVVLGAGLDTSSLRAGPDRAVFEVDRPGVLAWRQAAFRAALVPVPGRVRQVAVELGRDALLPALVDAGLDPARPTFVSWLGTTMYLDEADARRTLVELGGLAAGSELVADHVLPEALRDDAGRSYARAVSAAVGADGEPWRWSPSPQELREMLAACGFEPVTTLPDGDAVGAGSWRRTDHLRPMGLVGLVHARVARVRRATAPASMPG